jgi:hypothetical protein
LKILKPADMNTAWMTTVAAINAAAKLRRKNMERYSFAQEIVEKPRHLAALYRPPNQKRTP